MVVMGDHMEPSLALPGVWGPLLAASDGEVLLEELQALAELPQVQGLTAKSLFDRAKPAGSNPQLRGAIVRVACCKVQVDQKCNEKETGEDACPTFVEAVRLLAAKVQRKHGTTSCLEKAAQSREQASSEAEALSSAAEAPNAFLIMLKQQCAIQRAQLELQRAESRVARAAEAEQTAIAERVLAANEALEEV